MTVPLDYILTHCLQGLPEPLAVRHVFAGSTRAARRWAKGAEEHGTVVLYTMMLPTLPEPSGPMLDRRPEQHEADIDFAGIAYRLQTRTRGSPRPVRFVTATAVLNRECGGWCGHGRAIRQVDGAHEFLKAAHFFTLTAQDQVRYVSEQQLKAEGWEAESMPDALLRGAADREEIWVEIGGARYDKAKLLARDRAWRAHRYQLW